jgi:nucleotide-binding universal stress UspA family protein
MIKKIICPIDFSDASKNALEYAAKISQSLNGELLLINVERIMPVADAVSLGEGIGADVKENAPLALRKLQAISIETNKAFNIPTNYEVEVTTNSLAKTLTPLGEKSSMIVMGTNGADDLSQFFFGTNTYNVIKKAECPVLLVPENYPFRAYKNILYAFTDEEKGQLAMTQFHEFAKHFDSKITFLHVSKNDTEISRDAFSATKQEVEKHFDKSNNIDYKRAFSNDAANAIDDYMKENPVDLLVMAARHRNIFESIFKKYPLLEELSIIASYPILVLHS